VKRRLEYSDKNSAKHYIDWHGLVAWRWMVLAWHGIA
jgi:hypothetical protein